MIKDQEYLSKKASYCLDLAKKLGATDSSIVVSNSISETVNFRNKKLDESERQILVEKLAIKKLRIRLAESREELELATLSLEEERTRALDNLELIATSEIAKKVLKEQNL